VINFSSISADSVLGKVLRFPLRAVPQKARVPILQGPLRGKRWIAGSSDHGCWLGTYEHEKQRRFVEMIRRGDIVYDLGANVGWYTLLASALGASQIYSFEPSPENIANLKEHLRLNNVGNCSVFEVAVGEHPGTARFDAGPTMTTGHLVDSDVTNGVLVRLVSLDDLISSSGLLPPDVIKCDIEGAEYDALLGARHTLEKFGPAIALATHSADIHRLCREFLQDLGYSVEALPGTPLESEMIAWKAGRRR
jgi:FkbM family methyltransferase